MARIFWKGYLKLSLVTCPVIMVPATSDQGKVRFHTLNRRTGNRVVNQYVDTVTGKVVEAEDEIRGYPRGEDEYVMLEDEEIEAVALESTRTIDIETFVPADSIGWIWHDKPHYLVPDGEMGEEAFAVIREAMATTSTAGVSRLVMYRRERAIKLEPRDKGIIVWTLRYGDEVRDEDKYFAFRDSKPDTALMRLIRKLVDERTRPWDPSMVDDPVQDRLLEIIARRKKGKKRAPKAEAESERGGNVINIMDALRKSLATESKTGKRK